MTDEIAKLPPILRRHVVTNSWTAPFWNAARAHRLVIPKCGHCATFRMPPTPFCPSCRSQELTWVTAPSGGLLYSYTIVHKTVVDTPDTCLPYVPAVVEIPECGHVRLVTNMFGDRLEDLRIGATVVLHWREISETLTVPVYRLSS
jgi:uncharacterized OB-fold protein